MPEKISCQERDALLYEIRRSFAILSAEIPERIELKGFKEVPLREIVLEIRKGGIKNREYILALIEAINQKTKELEEKIYGEITVEEGITLKDTILGLKRARAELESELEGNSNKELEDTKRFYNLVKELRR
ncbi:MAG: DUF5788 family protein [Thermoplasmata archaeon]|nr:DUF5788 family protein [Thermoplasmata archaeon]